jgi:hypothetical protein
MASQEAIKKVNAEISKDLAEAQGHRENPRIISVLKHLLRLTNTDAQNSEMDKAEPPKPVCPHETVNRKTGKCTLCGEVPEEEE